MRHLLELKLGEQLEEVGVGLPPELFRPALITLHRIPGVRGVDLTGQQLAAMSAPYRDGRALTLLHDIARLRSEGQQILAEHDADLIRHELRIVVLLGHLDERHGASIALLREVMERLVVAAQVFPGTRANPAEALLVHLFHDLPDALALLVKIPDKALGHRLRLT